MSHTLDDAIQFRFQLSQRKCNENGRQFSLSYNEFKTLCFSACHYCGAAPEEGAYCRYNEIYYRSNGIDRQDSNLGYVPSNVVSCCAWCNRSKGDADLKDWLKKVQEISKRIPGGELDSHPLPHCRIADRMTYRTRLKSLRRV